MSIEKIIGNNIRQKREEKHIKLETLAKHLGLTKARMSQIEHGECRELTIARIQKIADYIGVNSLEIVSTQAQYVDITESENCSGFYGNHYNITPELIKSLADELVHRMKT